LTLTSTASGTISLPELKTIRGPFTVAGTSSLNGFSASDLETVSGPITIQDNRALNSISLENLESAGGEIRIQGNEGLREVVLDDLKRVNGALVLKGEFDRFVPFHSFFPFSLIGWWLLGSSSGMTLMVRQDIPFKSGKCLWRNANPKYRILPLLKSRQA
jgi:hypothetical protein